LAKKISRTLATTTSNFSANCSHHLLLIACDDWTRLAVISRNVSLPTPPHHYLNTCPPRKSPNLPLNLPHKLQITASSPPKRTSRTLRRNSRLLIILSHNTQFTARRSWIERRMVSSYVGFGGK
jgi:hypothetical protein